MLNKDEYVLTELKNELVKRFEADPYDRLSAEILVMIAKFEVEAVLGEAEAETEAN